MKLRHLHCFPAVAEELHFVRAPSPPLEFQPVLVGQPMLLAG